MPFKTAPTLILSTIAILTTTLSAQPDLSGRILDWNGNGVSDAVVKLVYEHFQVKTDYQGYYDFKDATAVARYRNVSHVQPVLTLQGTVLRFNVHEKSTPVKIALFTAGGRRIAVVKDGKISTGAHAINLQPYLKTSSVSILRATIGNRTETRRLTVPGNGGQVLIGAAAGSGTGVPTVKTASAENDSLLITRFGYVSRLITAPET